MTDATHLNLINHVHPVTGASVRMWAGIDCVLLAWREYLI